MLYLSTSSPYSNSSTTIVASEGTTIARTNGTNLTSADATTDELPPPPTTHTFSCEDSLSAAACPLVPGVNYTLSVVAVNALGEAPPSASSAFATCAEAPPAPLAPTAHNRTISSISIVWRHPTVNGIPYDNGAPISRYRVFWRRADSDGSPTGNSSALIVPNALSDDSIEVEASQLSALIDGLSSGRAYKFAVAAYNGVNRSFNNGMGESCSASGGGDGWGLISSWSSAESPLPQEPDPPDTVFAVMRRPKGLEVGWTAGFDNGAEVVAYTLWSNCSLFEGQPSSSDSLCKTNITENVQRTLSVNTTETLVPNTPYAFQVRVMTQLRRHCHPVSSKQGP